MTALFASDYWKGFADFWTGAFKNVNGVIIGTVVVGAVAILIIVMAGRRGKN